MRVSQPSKLEDTTPKPGEFSPWALSLLFRRLKLPKGASLRSLRHSHRSHLLANGVPLPAVSPRLRHRSIRTTQEIYSHTIHGQDAEAARKWEEFQNQPAGVEPQLKGGCSDYHRARRPFYRSPSIPNEVNSGGELLVQWFHIPDVDLAVL